MSLTEYWPFAASRRRFRGAARLLRSAPNYARSLCVQLEEMLLRYCLKGSGFHAGALARVSRFFMLRGWVPLRNTSFGVLIDEKHRAALS